MNPIFEVDRSLPIPLYQQLADSIRSAIRNGLLMDGQQLPTVQELDLARGTIIRAYELLEREGLLEKVQGRGTFVRCGSAQSRKDRAMNAIDGLFRELDGLGFSAAEIQIFLNLKLRERAEEAAKVKIALVEACPENLRQMAGQLQDIPGVELHSHLLDSLLQYPYHLEEDIDLILTTHAEELSRLLPGNKRVTPVALGLTTEAMVSIIRLGSGDRVGILCQSQRFGELLRDACRLYAEEAQVEEPMLLAQEAEVAAYLQDKQVLLLPAELEDHARSLPFSGQLIPCAYELDRGSVLYIREKSKRILKKKTL